MQLFFIRHAESLGNTRNIMQGVHEYELSELGHRQAALLCDYLQQCLFQTSPPQHIYCSPLQRTRQTIAPFCERFPDVPFETRDELVEVSSGIFSGLTWAEAEAQYPEDCKRFKAGGDWGLVPGGESRQALWQRAERFLDWLKTRHQTTDQLLIMTHGGWIRAALSVMASVPPDAPVFVCVDNTSVSMARFSSSRRVIQSVNDTRHLQDCEFRADFVPR